MIFNYYPFNPFILISQVLKPPRKKLTRDKKELQALQLKAAKELLANPAKRRAGWTDFVFSVALTNPTLAQKIIRDQIQYNTYHNRPNAHLLSNVQLAKLLSLPMHEDLALRFLEVFKPVESENNHGSIADRCNNTHCTSSNFSIFTLEDIYRITLQHPSFFLKLLELKAQGVRIESFYRYCDNNVPRGRYLLDLALRFEPVRKRLIANHSQLIKKVAVDYEPLKQLLEYDQAMDFIFKPTTRLDDWEATLMAFVDEDAKGRMKEKTKTDIRINRRFVEDILTIVEYKLKHATHEDALNLMELPHSQLARVFALQAYEDLAIKFLDIMSKKPSYVPSSSPVKQKNKLTQHKIFNFFTMRDICEISSKNPRFFLKLLDLLEQGVHIEALYEACSKDGLPGEQLAKIFALPAYKDLSVKFLEIMSKKLSEAQGTHHVNQKNKSFSFFTIKDICKISAKNPKFFLKLLDLMEQGVRIEALYKPCVNGLEPGYYILALAENSSTIRKGLILNHPSLLSQLTAKYRPLGKIIDYDKAIDFTFRPEKRTRDWEKQLVSFAREERRFVEAIINIIKRTKKQNLHRDNSFLAKLPAEQLMRILVTDKYEDLALEFLKIFIPEQKPRNTKFLGIKNNDKAYLHEFFQTLRLEDIHRISRKFPEFCLNLLYMEEQGVRIEAFHSSYRDEENRHDIFANWLGESETIGQRLMSKHPRLLEKSAVPYLKIDNGGQTSTRTVAPVRTIFSEGVLHKANAGRLPVSSPRVDTRDSPTSIQLKS